MTLDVGCSSFSSNIPETFLSISVHREVSIIGTSAIFHIYIIIIIIIIIVRTSGFV